MLGDHIRALKSGTWVHGIDLGDQRVLHLVEDPRLAPGDRLRRVYKPEFTAGSSAVELVVHRERTYPARAVVARAWSRFMDPSVVAMFRDSESFAAWCKIGRVPEAAPVNGAAAAPAKKPAPKATATARPAPKAAPKAKAKVKVKAKPAPRKAPKKAAKVPARKVAAKAVAKKRPAPKKSAAKATPAAKKKGRR